MDSSLVTTLFFASLLLFGFSTTAAHGHDDDDDDDATGGSSSSIQCTSDLSSLNLPFSTNNFTCNSVWSSQGFVLMVRFSLSFFLS